MMNKLLIAVLLLAGCQLYAQIKVGDIVRYNQKAIDNHLDDGSSIGKVAKIGTCCPYDEEQHPVAYWGNGQISAFYWLELATNKKEVPSVVQYNQAGVSAVLDDIKTVYYDIRFKFESDINGGYGNMGIINIPDISNEQAIKSIKIAMKWVHTDVTIISITAISKDEFKKKPPTYFTAGVSFKK